PCHRVVKSDGSLGGYSRGIHDKTKLLRSEGVQIQNNRILNFDKLFFKLTP
ncbi:MAG: MGMT family protein, partial [Candidatus Altiarchaeota archaeon]|nr:MGMT family protein [Candidatus Altiarchaeota archaeon]